MATMIMADGRIISVSPENGKHFTLEEMQHHVGGFVEMVRLPKGKVMLMDEDGKLKEKPVNDVATIMMRVELKTGQFCVGDVLICDDKEIR